MLDDRERADALAVAYEQRLATRYPDERRSRGAFYTPPELVAWVLDRALGPGVERILDPACGTGHFLVAAARRLGVRAVFGSDLDAEAVRIARLRLLAEDPTVTAAEVAERVRVADGLTVWEGGGFDAVVGNPPFLSQLRSRTAGEAGGLGAYTDTSAVFLHRALDLVRDGGTVALVQPLSLLAARDAGPVREAVAARGSLTDLWCSDRPVFPGIAVLVCVPVVRVGAGPRVGADGWGRLAAPYFGIPAVELAAGTGTLGDLATCTADFRDQYYGLVPHVREAVAGVPGQDEAALVTSGLVEPAACEWGTRATRFARRGYDAPVVDLGALRAEGALTAWADARLQPKVVAAGQGRVIEAVVDERGEWLPSVPVVSVVPHRVADLWRLLAVLLAPPVVAHAAARYLGTGLTGSSIKVSARQLAGLPLPADAEAWADGARLAEAAQRSDDEGRPGLLADTATAMTAAYAGDAEVLHWWLERARRSPGRGGQGPG